MKKLQLINHPNARPRKAVYNIVLDGIGISPHSTDRDFKGDAYRAAHTPVLDALKEKYLYRQLYAHGTYVGLPSDQEMGNSEVGHNAIGSGRIFPQGAKLVNLSIENNNLVNSPTWKKIIDFSGQHRSAIHFIGLLSDGYVHSHIDHLKYLVEQAASSGTKQVFLHALWDGRDVSPHSSPQYLQKILDFFATIKDKYGTECRVASAGGRMLVVMDRYEADWEMVERGWKMIVDGDAPRQFEDPMVGLTTLKGESDQSDQYVEPFVVVEDDSPIGRVEDGDGVIFFNYRGDRAIEICRAFEEELPEIKRGRIPKVQFVGMMQYDGDLEIPRNYLVKPPQIDSTMGEYLVKEGKRLFAISETQKFGHVTYFWNGNRSSKFDDELETYIKIESDQVPFDERPWMKAAEITDASIELIRSGNYDFGRINYPNGDMVGHSGSFDAARLAVEATDMALGRLLKVIEETGGMAIILADHGNCDEMYEVDGKGNVKLDDSGRPLAKTSHTLNPVPCFFFDPAQEGKDDAERDDAEQGNNLDYELVDNSEAGIANIAATTFNLMGFEAPEDYEPSLIRWK